MDRDQQLEVVNNQWPPLTTVQVSAALAELPDFREQQIASLYPSSRPMAAACLVTTASGKQVFLKRYHKDLVSASELEAKHSFVNQLADGGFSTPRFFCFNQGGSTLTTGEWIIEASAGAAGQDRYRDLRSWLSRTLPYHNAPDRGYAHTIRSCRKRKYHSVEQPRQSLL